PARAGGGRAAPGDLRHRPRWLVADRGTYLAHARPARPRAAAGGGPVPACQRRLVRRGVGGLGLRWLPGRAEPPDRPGGPWPWRTCRLSLARPYLGLAPGPGPSPEPGADRRPSRGVTWRRAHHRDRVLGVVPRPGQPGVQLPARGGGLPAAARPR